MAATVSDVHQHEVVSNTVKFTDLELSFSVCSSHWSPTHMMSADLQPFNTVLALLLRTVPFSVVTTLIYPTSHSIFCIFCVSKITHESLDRFSQQTETGQNKSGDDCTFDRNWDQLCGGGSEEWSSPHTLSMTWNMRTHTHTLFSTCHMGSSYFTPPAWTAGVPSMKLMTSRFFRSQITHLQMLNGSFYHQIFVI